MPQMLARRCPRECGKSSWSWDCSDYFDQETYAWMAKFFGTPYIVPVEDSSWTTIKAMYR